MLLTANKASIIKAGVTASFQSLGIDNTKVAVIREEPQTAGGSYGSFIPGRVLNSLLGFTDGRGYIIQTKTAFEVDEQATGGVMTFAP